MNAAETQARWGLPDWTRPDLYPDAVETSNSVWRWEFLRRQPNYRRQFSISAEWHTSSKLINEPALPILTDVGGAMMPDPRHTLDANLARSRNPSNPNTTFIVPREGPDVSRLTTRARDWSIIDLALPNHWDHSSRRLRRNSARHKAKLAAGRIPSVQTNFGRHTYGFWTRKSVEQAGKPLGKHFGLTSVVRRTGRATPTRAPGFDAQLPR